MCLTFAQNCLKNEKTRSMFPLNEVDHTMEMRDREKYLVQQARTGRLAKSSIPYLQRLLNKHSSGIRDNEVEDPIQCIDTLYN